MGAPSRAKLVGEADWRQPVRKIHRIAMAGFVCRRCCSNPSSRLADGTKTDRMHHGGASGL